MLEIHLIFFNHDVSSALSPITFMPRDLCETAMFSREVKETLPSYETLSANVATGQCYLIKMSLYTLYELCFVFILVLTIIVLITYLFMQGLPPWMKHPCFKVKSQ